MGEFLESIQGQSHRTQQRHSFHFSAIGNEPRDMGLPSEEWAFVLRRPYKIVTSKKKILNLMTIVFGASRIALRNHVD